MQVDWWDRESWFVQDHATGTVRGYTDAHGEMVHQYRFDAFGNLRGVDTFPLASSGGLFNSFRNRLGHQGLFAERVDHHTNALTLHPSGELWYQNRSRWYAPELGRFLSSDPNATGVPTVGTLASYGEMPGIGVNDFDWLIHYADGWDIYTSYGANPVMHQDATGLFLGMAALAVSQGLDSALSAFDTLGEIESGYATRGQLVSETNNYMSQQMTLLAFMDAMFDNSSGANRMSDRILAGAGSGMLVMVNGRNLVNHGLAGQRYPLADLSPGIQRKYPKSVYFKPTGFPDFTPYAKKEIKSWHLTGDRTHDAKIANAHAKYPSTPKGFTWHHVEGGVKMQLVPTDIHNAVSHTGGAAQLEGMRARRAIHLRRR